MGVMMWEGEEDAPRIKPLLERDSNSWNNDPLEPREIVAFGILFSAGFVFLAFLYAEFLMALLQLAVWVNTHGL